MKDAKNADEYHLSGSLRIEMKKLEFLPVEWRRYIDRDNVQIAHICPILITIQLSQTIESAYPEHLDADAKWAMSEFRQRLMLLRDELNSLDLSDIE